MAEHLDVRLVLEANGVENAVRVCDLLSEHGVRTFQQFSTVTKESLRKWGINDLRVYHWALRNAQSLTREVATSPHTLSTLKQQLLDRALYWTCDRGDVVRAQELISLGTNVNYHNNDAACAGCTPLHASAANGFTEVVAILLKQPSIDVNSHDKDGDTPLHRAAHNGRLDCVKTLLTHRETSLSLHNKRGETPLDIARRGREHDVVEYLQQQLEKANSLEQSDSLEQADSLKQAGSLKQESSSPHGDEDHTSTTADEDTHTDPNASPDKVHNEVTFNTSQLSQEKENDGKKIYEWEGEGLKLELPADSTATVKLKTVSSTQFELPKGSSQLSPVYWVECEGELNGSALLELQHCVEVIEERDLANLKFAVSRVDVDQGSDCKFELREGDFVGSSGKLEIAHFSAWRVVIVAMQSALGLGPVLKVGLYYQKVSSSLYMVNFLAVPKQDAWEKMLLKHFDTNSKYIGSKKTTAVLKDKAVSLLLHTDSGAQPLTDDHVVNGWKLKPKEDLTVDRREIFMPSSSSKPHPCQLELRWTGKGTPTQLSQKMVIGGTEGAKWLWLESPPPGTDILSSDEDLESCADGPAAMALQLCYSDIKKALDSHITAVVSSSFSQCLIPSGIHSTIINSPSMPSGDKVDMFLNAVERKVSADNNSVKVFADVLKDQGSYLCVIGSDLEYTYGCLLKGETPEHNTSASARIIGKVLREHQEYMIAYVEGAGVIPITNHLFSSEIITEYMYKCVTQNPHTQHASIVALECLLYVTLDHSPEGKLETLLNVFMKVESTGPDVASMIRQKLKIYLNKSAAATKLAIEPATKPTTKPAPEPATESATKPTTEPASSTAMTTQLFTPSPVSTPPPPRPTTCQTLRNMLCCCCCSRVAGNDVTKEEIDISR